MIAQLGATGLSRAAEKGAPQLTPQNLDQLFELQPHLMNELLALIEVDLSVIPGEAIARPADGKSLFIQQASYLADDQHILALVIPAVAAAFDGLELREFLFPIPQHMRLDAAQIADFADGEVPLSRDRRKFAIVAWFQHTPRRGLSVFDRDGM